MLKDFVFSTGKLQSLARKSLEPELESNGYFGKGNCGAAGLYASASFGAAADNSLTDLRIVRNRFWPHKAAAFETVTLHL